MLLGLWTQTDFSKNQWTLVDFLFAAARSVIAVKLKTYNSLSIREWYRNVWDFLIMEKNLDVTRPKDTHLESYISSFLVIWYPTLNFIAHNPHMFEQVKVFDVLLF